MKLDEDLVVFFLVCGTTPSQKNSIERHASNLCAGPRTSLCAKQIGFINNHLINHSLVITNPLALTFFMTMMTMLMIIIAIVSLMMMVTIIVITLILSE